MLKYIGSLVICMSSLSAMLCAYTQQQHTICSRNPALVQTASETLQDPMEQQAVKEGLYKASRYTLGVGAVAGLGALYLLSSLAVTRTITGGRAVGGSLLALFAGLCCYTAQVQRAMAAQYEEVTSCTGDLCPVPRAEIIKTQLPDGIHIFSSPNCPPCEKLHAARKRLGYLGMAVFEYNLVEDRAQVKEIAEELEITISNTPLLIIVQNSVVIGIIVGYVDIASLLGKLLILEKEGVGQVE